MTEKTKFTPGALARRFDEEAEEALETYYETPDLYAERIRELNDERFKFMAMQRHLIKMGSALLNHVNKEERIKIIKINTFLAEDLLILTNQSYQAPWSKFIK